MYGHMPKKERGYINMSEKKGFFKSFKEFAMKGNVVDMAVGVIIGGAFGKIVTSLVNDIIMPALGLLIGNISFSELTWVISAPTESEPSISIAYGSFIQNVLDFLIIALSIFCVISALRKVSERYSEKKRRAAEEAAAAEKAAKEAQEAEKARLLEEAQAKEEARREEMLETLKSIRALLERQ